MIASLTAATILFTAQTGSPVMIWKAPKPAASAIRLVPEESSWMYRRAEFSPDGNVLALLPGGNQESFAPSLWEVDTGRYLRSLDPAGEEINFMQFVSTELILGEGESGRHYLWSSRTGQCLGETKSAFMMGVAAGKLFAADENGIYRIDPTLQKETKLASLKQGDGVADLASETTAIVQTKDDRIYTIDLRTGQPTNATEPISNVAGIDHFRDLVLVHKRIGKTDSTIVFRLGSSGLTQLIELPDQVWSHETFLQWNDSAHNCQFIASNLDDLTKKRYAFGSSYDARLCSIPLTHELLIADQKVVQRLNSAAQTVSTTQLSKEALKNYGGPIYARPGKHQFLAIKPASPEPKLIDADTGNVVRTFAPAARGLTGTRFVTNPPGILFGSRDWKDQDPAAFFYSFKDGSARRFPGDIFPTPVGFPNTPSTIAIRTGSRIRSYQLPLGDNEKTIASDIPEDWAIRYLFPDGLFIQNNDTVFFAYPPYSEQVKSKTSIWGNAAIATGDEGKTLYAFRDHVVTVTRKDGQAALKVSNRAFEQTLALKGPDNDLFPQTVDPFISVDESAGKVLAGSFVNVLSLAKVEGQVAAQAKSYQLGTVCIVDVNSHEVVDIDTTKAITSGVLLPGNQALLGTIDGFVMLADTQTGKIVAQRQFATVISNVAAFEGKTYAAVQSDHFIHLIDLIGLKEIAKVFPSSTGPVTIAPDGRFDATDLEDSAHLNWAVGDTLTPLESYTREFYTPGLLPKLLAGTRLPAVSNLKAINRSLPEVSVESCRYTGNGTARVTIRVHSTNRPPRPLRDLLITRDGRVVDGILGPLKGATFTANIAVPSKVASIKIGAYCFNEARVRSRTTYRDLTLPTRAVRKRRAVILAFGMDAYQDPRILPLSSVRRDLGLVKSRLYASLKASGRYDQIEFLPVLHPAKADVRKLFSKLATTPGSKLSPDDTLIVYWSGHGQTGPSGLFELLTHHGGNVTSNELAEWMQPLDFEQCAIFLDTCYSATAISAGFRPGPFGDAGFGQLAYNKRMTLLAASAQRATEDRTGYGDLTRDALLTAPKKRPGNQTFSQWLSDAFNVASARSNAAEEHRVRSGSVGFRGLDSTPRAGAIVQRPVLFDFSRSDSLPALRW